MCIKHGEVAPMRRSSDRGAEVTSRRWTTLDSRHHGALVTAFARLCVPPCRRLCPAPALAVAGFWCVGVEGEGVGFWLPSCVLPEGQSSDRK